MLRKKDDLVSLVVIMILKDTETFQVLFIVSLFCAWNITSVEIKCSLRPTEIHQVPLFTSDGLGLVILVLILVLRIMSCLRHWF